MEKILKDKLLSGLPPEWPQDLLPEIQARVKSSQRKVVVLDDDPTGTQTVHGVPVLTEWPVEALSAELANPEPAFYVLTNSRSLPLTEAEALNAEIGRNLVEASRLTGREFVVVSRSDSTLRGHFPGEVSALAEAMEQNSDSWLVVPFFLEGGRYTIGDVHFVAEDDYLIPAGETEFANDAVFGYRASDLKVWVEEKTGGRISAQEVASVSIEDLRVGGPERVREQLTTLAPAGACVVNAASYRDLQVFVQGLLEAEDAGRRFIYRTAASFVQVRAGLAPRSLLTRADFDLDGSGGGLIVVGSYVPRTTSQVQALLTDTPITGIECKVGNLLDDRTRASELTRVTEKMNETLGSGLDVVVYTSRELITGGDDLSNLAIGQRVSESLVHIVGALTTKPRFLLAKGGITSSDVATQGLGVKRAKVIGQILPGVPVWELGPEARFPGLRYIVFPGNVGGPQALADVVATLAQGPGN